MKQKQIADKQKRIYAAERMIQNTHSRATSHSKQLEKERLNREINNLERNIVTLNKHIVDKEKATSKLQEKIHKEELNQAKKHAREVEQFNRNIIHQSQQLERRITQTEQSGEEIKNAVLKLQEPVKQANILFLSANPQDTGRLALDQEVRAIQQNLRSTEYRNALHFESRWAIQRTDLLQAINETKPTILHFSGHSNEESLALTDEHGDTDLLTIEGVEALINVAANTARLVVFNSCFSETHAQEAVKYVDFAIGMSDSILDSAACIFAGQLYSSLGFGLSVTESFQQARAQLILNNMIDAAEIPRLYSKEGLDPEHCVLIDATDN